jgi:CheY-like chemotaxis protein
MKRHWILLIDPFKNLLNTYRMIFEEESYLVETAVNIKEAQALFDKRQYSAVMMEYLPPHESIRGIVQWMKEKSPEIYILMVTNAAVDEVIYEDLFKIGVDDFILKPYSPRKIIVHIQKGLRQKEMASKVRDMERLNLLDPISGDEEGFIFNKTFLNHYLKQEIKRSMRHRHCFSILLIRLLLKEGFEKPSALFYSELMKRIRKFVRGEDVISKTNGEIVLLLPETDHNGSKALSGRLSSLIQNHPFFQEIADQRAMAQILSFDHFTYPDQFDLPESISDIAKS